MSNSNDILFYKIFRNLYIRRTITDIQYKYGYEIMLTNKANIFKKEIINDFKYINNRRIEESEIECSTTMKHACISDLIISNEVDIKDYNGHLLNYLNNIFDKIVEEKPDMNHFTSCIRSDMNYFISYIRHLYNKSYILLSLEDRKNIITLFLYTYGDLGGPIYPIWKSCICNNNASDRTVIDNMNFLSAKYIAMENLSDKSVIIIDKLSPIKHIFDNSATYSIVDMSSIHMIYIRYIYVQMEYINLPDKTTLYDACYNNENFSKLKSKLTIENCNIETVKLLYAISSIQKYNDRKACDYYTNLQTNFFHTRYYCYYYMFNRYTVLETNKVAEVLQGLIENNIDYKSIYMNVCNMIEEKRKNNIADI